VRRETRAGRPRDREPPPRREDRACCSRAVSIPEAWPPDSVASCTPAPRCATPPTEGGELRARGPREAWRRPHPRSERTTKMRRAASPKSRDFMPYSSYSVRVARLPCPHALPAPHALHVINSKFGRAQRDARHSRAHSGPASDRRREGPTRPRFAVIPRAQARPKSPLVEREQKPHDRARGGGERSEREATPLEIVPAPD
jgi:hypothetical protein